MVVYPELGDTPGTHCGEENDGIATDPHYRRVKKKGSPILSDLLNYATGQGGMQVTPLQAANLVATYASGLRGLVTLLKNEQNAPPTSLPVEDSVWRIVRRGMYQVVNVPAGTATQFAKLEHAEYVLCGKSGSAQTTRWTTKYRVDYHDGDDERPETVSANNVRFGRDESMGQMIPEDCSPHNSS